MAERLAAEDEGTSRKRVARNFYARTDRTKRMFAVDFSGLGASVGFAEMGAGVRSSARDSSGQAADFLASTWSFDRKLKMFGSSTSSRLASGTLLDLTRPDASPSYWFLWKEDSDGTTNLESVIRETTNLTGSIGVAAGVPALYKFEDSGARASRLLVVVKGHALKRLLAPTTAEAQWKTWGEVAESFDNTFGLPYNTFGGLPGEWGGNPTARTACDSVARLWGGFYCGWFAGSVADRIPALSDNPVVQAEFLKPFYQRGFLANKIGARILVRYLLELQRNVSPGTIASDVAIRFNSQSKDDASEYASPSLALGEAPEVEILESLGVEL